MYNDCLSQIFEEKGGVVTDGYICSFMIPETGYWEITYQTTLNIFSEDKAYFIHSVDYSIIKQKCEDAITDLQNSFNRRITAEDAYYWLSKYEILIDDNGNYFLHGGFIMIFRSVFLDIERFYNLIVRIPIFKPCIGQN